MKLLQELFKSPSEVEDTRDDITSTMTFDVKIAFSHNSELMQVMKERFSSKEFVDSFEEAVYYALTKSYRDVQHSEGRYSGNDWIDDIAVECKLKKFTSGAFESVDDTVVDRTLVTLADAYNKAIEMIHIIAEDTSSEEIADVEKQIIAAKKGLGLVNKLKTGPEKVKHAKRVMTNLNKLRSKLAQLKKAGKQQVKEGATPIGNSVLFEKVLYNNGLFVFESKHDKDEHPKLNNFVAKNNKNKAKTFRDRKNDYTRKNKHKSDRSDDNDKD